MRGYDIPLVETYRYPAASLVSVATVGRFTGPVGKFGRVQNLSYVVTTTTTVTAPVVRIDQSTALASPPQLNVPLVAANNVGASTRAQIRVGSILAPNLEGRVNVTTAATAGAADLIVTVGWFD